MMLLTCETYPLIQVNFGGGDSFREPLVIDAEEFALIKGFKAIGKRVTTFEVASFEELEPTRFAVVENEESNDDADEELNNDAEAELDPYEGKSQQDVSDEMTGQLHLDL